ncbi:ComEC family competence protein, partial [Candidatus Parcubacteria bacterium]|nr:ComEC family competence protein [Candidatus Parcubacteria bacterium]
MNGHQSKNVLIVVCSTLLFGVLFRSFFSLSADLILILLLIGCLLLILSLKARRSFTIAFGFIGVVSGFGWHSYMSTDMCAEMLDYFVGKELEVSGIVSSEPTRSGVRSSFHVKPQDIRIAFRGETFQLSNFLENKTQKRCFYRQEFSVSADLYPEIFFGDLVEVSAKLSKPKNFETDFGREFDYVSYLGKDDIYYTLPFSKIEILEEGYSGGFRRFLFKVKKLFLQKIETFVPEPESALLGGVLLGEKQSLGDDLEDAFVATGLIHIVVLSGYNVSIVAEAITYVLAFLPRALAYGTSSFGIILFMILTGANAPIVRASIMAILLLVAKFFGRPTEAGRLLLLVATVMVLINPSILLYDVSFHLSFLATFGLLYFFPIVDDLFSKKIPSLWGLREIASATISTQIVVLPYLLWKIGSFSII